MRGPLPDDGSADGVYQIAVVAANADGVAGPEQRFTFTYDSQPPRISSSLITLFPQAGSPGSIAGFQVLVDDPQPGSGIDWEAVSDDWIRLVGPDGTAWTGRVSGSPADGALLFVLPIPLASDGSQDGNWTLEVSVLDEAGNQSAAQFAFTLDTKAPVIDPGSLELNGKPIVFDTSRVDYPTAVNTESGVLIRVRITDDGAGVDLARSTVQVLAPTGEVISGTLRHNGVDRLEFESGPLSVEGIYRIQITALGADLDGLGVQPQSTLGATFLFEKTPPTAQVVVQSGGATFENEAAHFEGTATDPPGPEGTGVAASGVALVEIGGVGPGGETLEWEPVEDKSTEQQRPWAQWATDFLPSRSGKYRLSIRVTDRAGNSNILDLGTFEFVTALAFKGPVYVWPNPLVRSRGDVAHFSFETNQAGSAQVTVQVFDPSGTLVFDRSFEAARDRSTNSQTVTWDLRNNAGRNVVRGIYVFRLTLNDGSSTATRIGRLLIVE